MLQIPNKFKPLYEGGNRFYILTGGRGSAKSFNTALFALLLSYEQDQRILFTRYTMVSAHLSIIPEFAEKIEMLGLQNDFIITKYEIVNVITGNHIIFKGLKTGSGDNTAALKSLNAISCWILDEAEELRDENLFDKINLSIRSKKAENRVILILNPTVKEHFIYNRFFVNNEVIPGSNVSKGNTAYIHTTYLDNIQNLPEDYIQEAENIRINNPDKYNHVMLGSWMDKMEGVVYQYELGDFQSQGLDIFGLDFGFSIDPTALVRMSIDRNNRVIYIKEELYKTHLGTSDLQLILKEKVNKGLIYADSAESRLISDLRKSGINIFPATKGAGSVLEGIKLIQDYKLIIDPSSKNIIKELDNYSWRERGILPIDNYNHALDALRYSVSMSTKGVVSKYNVA